MSYTGEVTRGGAPDVRELSALRLTKVSVGPMDNNAYLLSAAKTGERAAGRRRRRRRRPCSPWSGTDGSTQVVTTHQHRDHWQALARGGGGHRRPDRSPGGRTPTGIPVPTDVPLDDGDRVRVGDVELEVIDLVGHTPGSVALLYDDPAGHPHLFTGDSLFPGGVGGRPRATGTLPVADRRRRAQDLRPAARRHLVLPRARQRLDAGRRAAGRWPSGAPAAGDAGPVASGPAVTPGPTQCPLVGPPRAGGRPIGRSRLVHQRWERRTGGTPGPAIVRPTLPAVHHSADVVALRTPVMDASWCAGRPCRLVRLRHGASRGKRPVTAAPIRCAGGVSPRSGLARR